MNETAVRRWGIIVLIERAQSNARLLRRIVCAASAQNAIGDFNHLLHSYSHKGTAEDNEITQRHIRSTEISISSIKFNVQLGCDDVRNERIVPTRWVNGFLRWVCSTMGQNEVLSASRAWQVGINGVCSGEVQLETTITTSCHACGEYCIEVSIEQRCCRMIIGTAPRSLAIGLE